MKKVCCLRAVVVPILALALLGGAAEQSRPPQVDIRGKGRAAGQSRPPQVDIRGEGGAAEQSRPPPAGVSREGGIESWQDGLGRTVALSLPVERVASLAPSVTEILFAIGAQDKVVGVSNQCDYPLAAKLKPKIGNFNQPDLEKIKAAGPDMVLFAEYARPADLEALEHIGIKAAVLSSRDLADLSATIRLVGRITGRAEQADSAAAEVDRAVAEVSAKIGNVPPEKRPRVYIEVEGPAEIYAVGAGSFMGDIIRVAGGRNVFAEGPGPYLHLTPDDVIRSNPEVIFIDHPWQYKVGLAKRPGWSEVAAVRNGRVYDGTDFDLILLNRPAPRVGQSIREVARILHPEAFREP